MQKIKNKTNFTLILLGVILVMLFVVLFYHDNKYQSPPPYGKCGVLKINESDIASAPIFLIDGWLLTDRNTVNLPTYIGEYSNLQRNDLSVAPHGRATYQLTLNYSGAPRIVEIDFPKLATEYTIFLGGKKLASGSGSTQVSFLLHPGDQTLIVETVSSGGYYSGIYFPPTLGSAQCLKQIENIQSFSYALAFLMPIVLSVFTFALWRRRNDPTAFWFGLLCCFYALYISHYFVYLFRLPLIPYWNFIEGFALYGLVFCVIQLTALAADMITSKTVRIIQLTLWIIPFMLMVFYLYIPIFTQAVILHSALKDMYFIFAFCCVIFLSIRASLHHSSEYLYILSGCVVFSIGLVLNLLFSNHFEPILFFWQFEWCGLFLVLLFGKMMMTRNRRILAENAEFSYHLEQLVEKRTEELSMLMSERKAFFSDMAHDLKAPIFATQAFIREIRRNATGIDGELAGYLEAVEKKQQEMARRVQGLSAINQLDKITEAKQLVSIQELLAEMYATHNGEAEV
ncbi:MAG: hypothetical protein RRZ73_04810, partial [Oscillospiraceae bacterium]